ncbi:VTT domain-containing protein [Undibacterium seohonense]|jgi:membrane-associated protein|uniref:VTT domain-containing protein n=1 Tax=Undibacterium seohonense TaxID=1344950 RepID=A0ABR6X664_9BURK|nr:VTT domain-containing protein [Undibacterium seohonense]MBC3808402.1 VTT domain-containing protein [Undibacterium seohonense]
MDLMQFLDMVLHVDKMGQLIEQYGTLIYVVLFAIVFCETAFVIFPFLPGDSLLFIAGTFCAAGAMDPWFLIAILLFASISGNSINYWIGSTIGHKVMAGNSRWIDKGALQKTHAFYEKHGGKTIVLARFTPIVRTFAPFVAGFSEMSHRSFQFYNVLGAILWIVSLILAGYYFGHIPLIKNNLSIIVMVGVGAAIVPIILGLAWKFGRKLFSKKVS